MTTEALKSGELQHIPDVLETLAQLPNDEVFTPPKLANAMLDVLPAEVWNNPDYTWLDPVTKSGIFLREVFKRLMVGLQKWQPDPDKRREHILRKMLYGAAITSLSADIARRSIYQTKNATGADALDTAIKDRIVVFDDSDGNVRFVETEHVLDRQGNQCVLCRAPAKLIRDQREHHAYSFIHDTYPTKEMAGMKFDVIVGNPPYQIGTEGHGATASTIYHFFVERAIAQSPRYVLMITPSRWFAGGKGLYNFRDQMIKDRRLVKLVDNPKLFDVFPQVEIKGGVSYFLWDREYDGNCEFSTRVNGSITSTATRDLRAGDGVLLRDNRAVAILDKIRGRGLPSVEAWCSVTKPFGLTMRANYTGSVPEPFEGAIPLIYNNRVGYSRPDQIQRNHQWVDRWKVLLPRAGDGHGREVSYVLGEPIALAPGSACTQTYFVAGMFDTEKETENFAFYLATKFVRFLVLQRKLTQDVTPDRFRFVPQLDLKRRWTDGELYEEFGLTEDESGYIEATIQPREPILSLKSPIPASHLPGGAKYRIAADPDDDALVDEE